MDEKVILEYLEDRRKSVQELWELHSEQAADWKKYFLRYQFEGLRWLIGTAVAVLGISRFSANGVSSSDWQNRGLLALVVFIVLAVALDWWRCQRLWKSQCLSSDFAEEKLGGLRKKIAQWQIEAMDQKIDSASFHTLHNESNSTIIEWSSGRKIPCLELVTDWILAIFEVALLCLFAAGVILFFLPSIG